MKRFFFLFLIAGMICIIHSNTITVLEMDNMIAGGNLSYLEREISIAEDEGSIALILLLNTPGGLVDTTFKINELILNARLPVIVYVYPSGAMAASAGAFIVLAADIAAMAPVTTIGAAQPLSITAEGIDDAGEKTTNFLARHAKSLAEDKNRPLDIAEGFVKENITLTSAEALEEGVIDYVALNLEDLLDQINGHTVEKQGVTYILDTRDSILVYREMHQREIFQQWISNPQIAFLLLMLGVMGLYFGLSNPGTYVPEILGAIVLIIGIYGIGLFSTNVAGIILLVAGIILLVAEIFTAGFGILGIGGIISLIIGALLLPLEPLMGIDWYSGFIKTVIGLGLGLGIVLVVVLHRIMYSRKRTPTEKINLSVPATGTVVEELNPVGTIKARGELWKARCKDGKIIELGKEVKVNSQDSLTLLVEEVNNHNKEV